MSSVALGSDVDERAWWREHPDPQVTRSEDRLVLWNYPVAGTKLAPEHAAALRSFLSILLLAPAETGSTVSITGHASTTGEASANEALALERGENVASYLRGLGFRNLEVTAAGSSEPADPAPSGQALARNRRVEVTLYYQRIEPPPRLDPNEPLPPAGASPPSGASMYFEAGFDIPLGELDNGTVAAAFSIAGTAKFKVTRGDPQAAAGIVLSGDGLSAEFEAKLRDDLNAKLAIEPGGAGEVPTAKVSLDGEVWGLPTEVGFQTKINFLIAEVTFATLKLPDVELENGTTLSLEIEGKFVVEWGASKVVLARAGVAAAAAAEGAVALGAVPVVVVLVIGGTIYASERAKEQMAALVVDVAARDGAASRVAFEALGADSGALAALRGRRLELKKAGGETSERGFESGQQAVGTFLDALGEGRAAKVQAWTTAYATNRNATDFDVIRKEIVAKLEPFQNDARPLAALIPEL